MFQPDKYYPNNDDDMQRFTAAGRPFNRDVVQNAPLSGFGGVGNIGGGMFATQKMLPHRFTDQSIITVPVRRSDMDEPPAYSEIGGQEQDAGAQKGKKKKSASWTSRLGIKDHGSKTGQFVTLSMTRADYLMYCAKDERGQYIGSEPQEISRRVLGEMAAEQSMPGWARPGDEWRNEAKSKGWGRAKHELYNAPSGLRF